MWVPHKQHQHGEQHIQHTIKVKHIMDIYAKCCSLNTTHSNMHNNPTNGQQFYCPALSDDQIDPPDSPQCASTPVKSLQHKSEKNVSKSANKLT